MNIRMIKSCRVLGIAILAILSGVQVGVSQESLTLKDALRYALNNSEAMRKARLEVEGGQLKVSETRALALPQLDAISTLTNNLVVQKFILPVGIQEGQVTGEFAAIPVGQTWNAMTQVQISQQIFNQQVFTGLKAARSSAEFYRLSAKLAEENLIQQVATNYYQVIITREQLDVIDANLERLSQLERVVDNQFQVGLAKKIDLDRIRVNRDNLLAQRDQLQSAVVLQENLLKYYMGMPITASVEIPEWELSQLERETHLRLQDKNFQVEDLVSYQLLQKSEDLLQLQKKAFQAEYFPTLSLGGNYTISSQSNRLNVYSGSALNTDAGAVTLNLRIPIFDGGARRARVRQADIEIQKTMEDLRSTSNALAMAYENAKIQIQNSLTTIDRQKANREFAEEVFENTRNNYQNGLATLTDLMTAETELVTAQNSYNQALLNYKVAEIELIKSNGQIQSLLGE